MDIRGYSLYRVSYFILNNGVGQSIVVAKTPEQAEDIVKNSPKFNGYNSLDFYETATLHRVDHISPELLLEIFSPPPIRP